MFQQFAQASASTSREYGGTGLGLAICSRLVDLMDGEIDVESELGVGSNFWFKLTLPIDHYEQRPEVNTNIKQVLIVDDYPTSLKTIAEQLRFIKLTPTLASSVKQAWQKLDEVSDDYFDLIITDLDMPDETGLDFARQLSEHQSFASIPVILITASASIPSRAAAILAKLAYAGSKPTSVSHMISIINQATGTRSTATAETSTVKALSYKKLSVLIAEDNKVNAMVISGMLNQLGHEFTICDNGEKALSTIQSGHSSFDAILMDCEMPVMDGFSSTREIRRYEKDNALTALPIIALTAHALESSQQQCTDAGMNGFLTKPVTMNKLAGQLNQLSE